jgi:hypothetical protein
MEANMIGQMTHLPNLTPGIRVVDTGDMFVVDADVPSNTFNCVVGARFADDDVPACIASVLQYVQSRSHPFAWWVGPGSTPADLGRYLQQAGLLLDEVDEGMAVDLRELPDMIHPEFLDIQRVLTLLHAIRKQPSA